MSEKCPMGCNETLSAESAQFYTCGNCWFRCDKADLPRIAAAMELAKTIVEAENCKAEDEYKYQEFVEWARQYVLEVFK